MGAVSDLGSPLVPLNAVLVVVQTLTFGALLWYAFETMRLRKATERLREVTADQARIGVMPVMRVAFNKAPDKVFLENIGTGIATRALLQGFRVKADDGNMWRCMFEPVYTVQPGKDAHTPAVIEMEAAEPTQRMAVLDERVVLDYVRRALSQRDPLVLSLHWTDVLGNAYRSEARIDWLSFSMFREHRREHRPTTLPPTREVTFPDSLEPA